MQASQGIRLELSIGNWTGDLPEGTDGNADGRKAEQCNGVVLS